MSNKLTLNDIDTDKLIGLVSKHEALNGQVAGTSGLMDAARLRVKGAETKYQTLLSKFGVFERRNEQSPENLISQLNLAEQELEIAKAAQKEATTERQLTARTAASYHGVLDQAAKELSRHGINLQIMQGYGG